MTEQLLMRKVLERAFILAVIVLTLGWILPDISFEIALILGGIPLLIILVIFLYKNIATQDFYNQNSLWRRGPLYLMVILTVAFSANGIMVSFLYILTFFTIKDGKVTVQIAFGEQLGFDAIQMIYNVQFIISLVITVIGYILIKKFTKNSNKLKRN
jgi:hypothetical protein